MSSICAPCKAHTFSLLQANCKKHTSYGLLQFLQVPRLVRPGLPVGLHLAFVPDAFCHTEPHASATLDPLALSKAPAHSGFCTWSPSWLSYCHGRCFNCSVCFSVLVCNTRIIQEPTSEVPGVVWKNHPIAFNPSRDFSFSGTWRMALHLHLLASSSQGREWNLSDWSV